MAPSRIRKALGAVKDQTSIGLAKVSSNSNTVSDLDVAIVKATRHDEHPAEEKYIREILSLTCYSRSYITACVNTLARRLNKTRNWTVALKTLILIHRLLVEGDQSYEQEIFFATRRGTRILNMSDFRDTSRSDSWDFSAFVRTFALYLDERLEYRVQGRRSRRSKSMCDDGDVESSPSVKSTPVREMKTDRIFSRTQHLLNLLDRYLACRPTGSAKNNRIVAVALYPLVKESYQLYYDISEIMAILIDRFMELEIPECVRVHEIFTRISKQFEELDMFYNWCKTVGIARSAEYPELERITSKKLAVMDEFIRDKSALAGRRLKNMESNRDSADEANPPEEVDYQVNAIKALPAPESAPEDAEGGKEEISQKENEIGIIKEEHQEEEADLLNLKEDTLTVEKHGDNLALALFDGSAGTSDAAAPKWEAFAEETADWETALVQTASNLSNQKAAMGGGFDLLLLDGMYQQSQVAAASAANGEFTGSASSVAYRPPAQGPQLLALPAPPVQGVAPNGGDPFAASLAVMPPAYVQISDMEKKQHFLVEEKSMWQQYATDGMQGQLGLARLQANPHAMGGYVQRY